MNREVLTLGPDTPLRRARELLLGYGVGAAPIVDEGQRPLGVLALRDIAELEGQAQDRMSRPALCVSASALVEDAARQLAAASGHHLVVVDSTGSTVGIVSTHDLLRAVLGMPTPHPQAFPHWDEATQLRWTDDAPLDVQHASEAADEPGVVALVVPRQGQPDAVIWAEAAPSIRARLKELTTVQARQQPALKEALQVEGLRFRAAELRDDADRARTLALLRDRLEHLPPPGST